MTTASRFKLLDPLLELLVLFLQASLLNDDLICMLHCVVDQEQAMAWTISILSDHSNVLPESLLCVLNFSLEAFHVLLVHDLLVWLLEGDLSAEVLHLTIGI